MLISLIHSSAQASRENGSHSKFELPLVVLLFFSVDPLFRVGHPVVKISRIQWDESCYENLDSIFYKVLRQNYDIVEHQWTVGFGSYIMYLCRLAIHLSL